MKQLPPFPAVPADEQTPWVVALGGLIEQLREPIQQPNAASGRLQEELAIRQGERAGPTLKPSRLDPAAGRESESAPAGEAVPQRPGSAKRSKTAARQLPQASRGPPRALPEGSRVRGYEP